MSERRLIENRLPIGKCGCYNFKNCFNCPFRESYLCDTLHYLISQGYQDFETCIAVMIGSLRKIKRDLLKEEFDVYMVRYMNYGIYVDKYGNLKEF